MRIEHIEARNYRAWGNLSLHLAPVRGAVITGGNGLGKSSLLEAFLWCLFGKSRSASADGVIRIGCTATSVEVVVATSTGRWQVRRTRSNKGQGKTEVALERDEGGTWVASGGAGKRGNDQAIVEALGVDYETLLATSVAIQGDAGRFTKAQPAERRQVLATMLDLDRWAVDAKAARAKAAACETLAAGAERQVRLDAAELVAAARAQLEAAQAAAVTAGTDRDAVAEAVRAAERSLTLAEAHAAESDRHKARAAELRTEAADLRAQAQAAQGRASQLATLRARLESAEDARRRLPGLADALAEAEGEVTARRLSAEARQVSVGTLQRAEAEAEGAEQRAREAWGRVPNVEALRTAAGGLEAAQAAATEAAAEVDRIVANGAATCGKDRLAAATEAVAEAGKLWLDADSAALEARRATAKAATEAHAAQGALSRLEAEAAALRPQVQVMGEVPCGAASAWPDPAGNPCDLAGTCKLLGGARQAQARLVTLEGEAIPAARVALADAQAAHATAEAAERAAADRAGLVGMSRGEAQAALRDVEQKRAALLAEHAEAKAAAERAAGKVAEAERAAQALADAADLQTQAEAAGVQATAARAKATDLRAALPPVVDVASAEEALTKARAAHGQVQQLASGAEGLRTQVEVAEGAQGEADRLNGRAATAETQAAEEDAKASAGAELAEARATLRAATDRAAGVAARLQAAEAAVTAAQVEVARAEQVAEASEAAKAEGELQRTEAVSWTRLAKACAVAPTLKLEGMALPAIEAECNRILGVISNGELSLQLHTQRALKTSDHQRETLDLVISSPWGTLPFEDLSGGQQFRVELALRCAMARILSARAGAQIGLLVIDEGGFGALDHDGLEKCKEALRLLVSMGEFQQVLIVTHIESLADAMPHRIVVRAGADGSTAEVV